MKPSITKKIGLVGIIVLSFMIAFAIAGPSIIPYNAGEQSGLPLQSPDKQHLLGTNDIGQDILAEIAVGARVSLTIGIISALFATLLGALIGLISGYSRGWIDSLCMRIVDISLTLPFLPLMIIIGVYLGPSLITQILVITLVMWAGKAREIRSQVLSWRGRGPVLAAQSMGAGKAYLLRRHILPAVAPLMIPQFVRAVNASIMLESSLSFLGLGDPLAKSWGSILFYANARSAFLTDAWLWWVLPPGLCIAVTVISFSFIGYFLEEWVNPRLRSNHATGSEKIVKPSPKVFRLPAAKASILEVTGLTVTYPKSSDVVNAVKSVNLHVDKGEVLGIVGESGSGKTTVAAAIMQLLKAPAKLREGTIRFHGKDLALMTVEELRHLRGNRLALIPQAAMNALNPVLNIREQLAEAVLSHHRIGRQELDQRVERALKQVGLASQWGSSYPHELSGGMRQRVVIAMALMNDPDLVIADEPTTGLDVKVQVEIIKLLKTLQQQLGLSMIFISHDLNVVLRLADRIIIMNQGKIVDQGKSAALAKSSNNPYTRRLIDAMPRLNINSSTSERGPEACQLLQVK